MSGPTKPPTAFVAHGIDTHLWVDESQINPVPERFAISSIWSRTSTPPTLAYQGERRGEKNDITPSTISVGCDSSKSELPNSKIVGLLALDRPKSICRAASRYRKEKLPRSSPFLLV